MTFRSALFFLVFLAMAVPALPARADFDAGLVAYKRGDYAKAFAEWKPLADFGDAKAQSHVGRLYAEGKGIERDPAAAVQWYRKAADQGYASAQNSMGLAYARGLGVAKNLNEAVGWYKKAAAQGFPSAETNLGHAYRLGNGTPQDFAEAVKWFQKAAGRGYPPAELSLGQAYQLGQGVEKDVSMAAVWYRKAAEKRYPPAETALGLAYARGDGVAKDPAEAVKWYRRAAIRGFQPAQTNVGLAHIKGLGADQDNVLAYVWLNLAVARGFEPARKLRDQVVKTLNPAEVTEAQALTRNWKPGHALPEKRERTGPTRKAGSGTGFIVSAEGHVLTNNHVVRSCREVFVGAADMTPAEAKVVAKDEGNDLALLKLPTPPGAVAHLRAGRGVRPGDAVVSYGFPLAGSLSSQGNLTTGTVAALAGLKDDTRMMQISAPIQKGNSGGPLLDMSGNVVGVVTSKLNALRVAQATGDLPQNINFAIKASIARLFMEAHGVKYQTREPGKALDAADIGEAARAFTLKVECRR